jgi:gamma-glutamylcysteine synthetase
MSRQAIFDKVFAHILAQGPSMGTIKDVFGCEKQGCVYRGKKEDGTVTMCAAGLLIKDEFYSPDLENKPSTEGSVMDALEKSGVSYIDISFIGSLQTAHDGASLSTAGFKETYMRNMEQVAEVYRLKMPEVTA